MAGKGFVKGKFWSRHYNEHYLKDSNGKRIEPLQDNPGCGYCARKNQKKPKTKGNDLQGQEIKTQV